MNKDNTKIQCHLLSEAFPGKFTICLVFDRTEEGTINSNCNILCNPQNEFEFTTIKTFLAKIGAE